ncbi:MAG: hypothetical protein PHI01_03520, partial [Candidatus Izemoplasmatales bacterium]|nr:hypothetical protein [Candidatus Izemoplasmatales bacterium]
MKNKLFPLLIIITLVMVVFGLFGCEDITGLSTTLSLPATTSLTTSTTSSATDTSNISSTAITTLMTTAPLSTTEITSLTVPTTVISTEAVPVVIFQEEFDYTEGTNLGATALWTENKAGNATIVMDDDRTVLILIETGSEARFDAALTDLGSQRYVLVYGFKQGTGGASFTIELLAGENRVFTVGATRYNRVSYRNPDGSETAVAADTYSIVPGKYYQAVVIFDTETNIYKYYVIDGDDIFEATPSGGLAFMTAEAITSIRIRI